MPQSPDDAALPFAVLVLNWNNEHDTIPCVESLRVARPGVRRVVVIDNGSRPESVERLRAWARESGVATAEARPGDGIDAVGDAWLVLLLLPENLGFSGGNNVGIELAAKDAAITHFLLLNNDAVVAPDYFAELRSALVGHPDAGLLTGTIFYFDPPSRVWYAGGVSQPYRAITLHRTELPSDDRVVPTEFVCGCTMLISRPVLEALGPLPEVYFPAYCEDTEYSYRARERGFPVLYAPRAKAYHKIGATLGHSARSVYIAHRHRGVYLRRNLRGVRRISSVLYLLATKPARAVVELLRGRPRHAWAVAAGTLSGLLTPAIADPPPRPRPPARG